MKMKKNRLAFLHLGILSVTLALIFTLTVKTGILPGLSETQDEKKLAAREAAKNNLTIPGRILDSSGTVLAWTNQETGERNYIDSYRYSPILAIESGGIQELYYDEIYNHGKKLYDESGRLHYRGGDLTLTLDDRLQAKATALLENTPDASIVILADDGSVECMASSPTFNINTVASNFNTLLEEEGTLLNPAKDSLSPVGSVLKPILAQMLVEAGDDDFQIDDKGYVTVDGKNIHNSGSIAHGSLDLGHALKVSSNTYFIKAGLSLGDGQVNKTFQDFSIGETLHTDFGTLQSISADSYTNHALALKVLGQNLSLSTTHLCIITKAMMTGELVRPMLVAKCVKDDKIIVKGEKDILRQEIFSKSTISYTNNLMGECAESYGLSEEITGTHVLAKTGTAEDTHGENTATLITAWPASNPSHFMVIQERSTNKYGADLVPLAVDMIRYYEGSDS